MEPPLIRIAREKVEETTKVEVMRRVAAGFSKAINHMAGDEVMTEKDAFDVLWEHRNNIRDSGGLLTKQYFKGMETHVDNAGNMHWSLRISIDRHGKVINL